MFAHDPGVSYSVYIMVSQTRGTLHIGVTDNVARRVQEHRDGKGSWFAAKHDWRNLYPLLA